MKHWNNPFPSSLPSQFNSISTSSAGSNTPENHLELKWKQVLPPGAGLKNMGNTCSVNVVLQCLTHTPPLANYMLSGEHSRTCQENGLCFMCVLEKHIIEVFKHTGQIIKPVGVTSQLTMIKPEFKLGKPMSSIAFYQALLEALHQSHLNGCMRNQQTTEDSLVNQIFKGTLQHALTCPACSELMLQYSSFRDIGVSTEGPGNFTQDLTWYMMVEQLGFTMSYCWRCKNSRQAHCKTTFHHLPNVLVIHLKPREKDETTKTHVRYPEYLDMRQFMSQPSEEPKMYQLYGVMTLVSFEKDLRHVYCYIKASNGQWYKMDDDKVTLSDKRVALEQKALMLYYIRSPKQENGETPSHLWNAPGQSPSQTQTGPPCNEEDNVGVSKSRADGSLNQHIKLNRQSWYNYQHGEFHRPKRNQNHRKISDRKHIGDCENSLSTTHYRKRRIVDDGNDSQEESSAKRKKSEHTMRNCHHTSLFDTERTQ